MKALPPSEKTVQQLEDIKQTEDIDAPKKLKKRPIKQPFSLMFYSVF